MRNNIFLKKGEIFRCWNCNKIVVKAKVDLQYEIKITDIVRADLAALETSTPDKTATILSNKSKCANCGVLIYQNITYRKYGLEDKLFEI